MNKEMRYRNKNPQKNSFGRDDWELISVCYAFRTLPEHADIYIKQYGKSASDKAFTVRRLEALRDRGFLVSDEEFRREIRSGGRPSLSIDEPAPISVIGIPTANRPEDLERMLSSLFAHLARYGRAPEIVVADDSDTATLAINREAIDKFQRDYKGKIVHLDPSARGTMATNLSAKSGVAFDVTSFAVMGDQRHPNRTGALRNSILLRAAGRKLLMLDDDVIARFHAPHGSSGSAAELLVTSSYSSGHHYFEKLEDAFGHFPSVEVDFVGAHEARLGSQTGEVLGQHDGDDSMRFDPEPGGMTGPLFNALKKASEPASKVRLTFAGSVGSSWSKYQLPFDTSKPRPHDLPGATRDAYARNKTTPFVSRMTEPRLYYGSTSVGLNMGIDARELPAPFPPLYRNQDNVFGLIMNKVYPSSFSFHLPLGIEHARSGARPRESRLFANLETTAFVTRCLIGTWNASEGVSPKDALKALGEHLVRYGQMSAEEIETAARYETMATINTMRPYSLLVRAYFSDSPSWWLEDIDAIWRKSASEHVNSLSFLSDLSDSSSDGSWKLFQEWIAAFGSVICAWPDMYEAARDFSL